MPFLQLRRRALSGLTVCITAFLYAGQAGAGDFAYVVRPGDNPWNLTERYLKDISYWPRIQKYNRIVEPRRMRPGSRLLIPEQWLRLRTRSVTLDAVHGEVMLIGADGRSHPAEAGAQLGPGTRLLTGDSGSAALGFADGSRVQLRPDSELGVRRSADLAAGAGSTVQLELLRGSVDSLVTPRSSPASRFEIDTPSAVAAVRGTRFRVRADERATRSEVIEGRVVFGNSAGQHLVGAGHGSSAAPGEGASAPRPLLPPPPPGQALFADRLPINLPFPALEGASAYRVQISASPTFDTVLSDRSGPRAAVVAGATLPDGDYQVRVRAIDDAGFEGADREWPMTLDARPEPPVLVEPAPAARVSDERPRLRWSRAREDERWRLQLSASPHFDPLLAEQADLEQPAFLLEDALPPGTYYWRVASSNPDEGMGPFSDVQAFRRPPPGPAIEAPQATDEGLVLRWRDAGEGVRYQLQIARDAEFVQPLVDAPLHAANYLLRDAAVGTWYLRVRSFDTDGFEGDWAPVQVFEVAPPPSFCGWCLLPLPLLLLLLI